MQTRHPDGKPNVFVKKHTFSLETLTTFPISGIMDLIDLSNSDMTRRPNFGQYFVGIV
jgi:hypothetical protein